MEVTPPDSQDKEEDEQIYEEVPRQYLNRGHYMENMKFPENSNELVIIPSNRKGTGFIKTCYDPRLKGIMTEQEFKFIIEQAAKINAKAYSQKRIGDEARTPKWFVWNLTIASAMTCIVFFLLHSYLSELELYDIFYDETGTFFIVTYSILTISVTLVAGVMILNYRLKDAKTVPYTKIVKKYLDEYFEKVNQIYAKRGLQWKVAPGHYWIELCIDTTIKRNQKNMIYLQPGVLRDSVIEMVKEEEANGKKNHQSLEQDSD